MLRDPHSPIEAEFALPEEQRGCPGLAVKGAPPGPSCSGASPSDREVTPRAAALASSLVPAWRKGTSAAMRRAALQPATRKSSSVVRSQAFPTAPTHSPHHWAFPGLVSSLYSEPCGFSGRRGAGTHSRCRKARPTGPRPAGQHP